ncbi:hypothetical protein AVEN_269641-1 [Araneus ventricosus]|uniref:DUF4817 domain-containing protein n=1 Tax=Araneus ventricosus TaxID=182803 RepID=A0A4Y2CSI7_ARAVE|nr:hypothetical protein AVEN_269641-1 [Araneus ventricosus]
MAAPQEQAQLVAWFIEFKFAIQVERKFRTTCNRSPPQDPQFMNAMKDLCRQIAKTKIWPPLAEASMMFNESKKLFVVVFVNRFAARPSIYKYRDQLCMM